jgi:glycosyltransferase involved in cell wall biosynthesis
VRVLFLTYSYLPNLGGVERSVHNLAHLLGAHGHDVAVATHDLRAVPFRWTASDRPPTLHLHVPSQTDPRPAVRAFRAVINPINVATLAGFCRLRGIAVVHAHHLNTDTVYARQLARLLGVRFVLTLRGGETEEWITTPARRRYVVEQLEHADAVTAVATSLLEEAVALAPGIRPRASVIPNPVDPSALRAALAAPAPADADRAPYVIFAGRLEAMKHVECLLDAYATAIAENPALGVDLLIAGAGSLTASLEARARAGAGSARIRFLGRVDYGRTLRLIADARAVVLPSRCSEGCPNVVLEAMALGTPVVLSDLASHTELVEDGVSGLVFPIGDAARLARHLAALAARPEWGVTLAAAATERLRVRHDGATIAARYGGIYAGAARA